MLTFLLLQGFNVPNGLLTPTFKLKRPQLKQKYMDEIKKLYATNGEAQNFQFMTRLRAGKLIECVENENL